VIGACDVDQQARAPISLASLHKHSFDTEFPPTSFERNQIPDVSKTRADRQAMASAGGEGFEGSPKHISAWKSLEC
jgi:hypothetical protein